MSFRGRYNRDRLYPLHQILSETYIPVCEVPFRINHGYSNGIFQPRRYLLLKKTDNTDQTVYFYEELLTFKNFKDQFYMECKKHCQGIKYAGKGYLKVVDMGILDDTDDPNDQAVIYIVRKGLHDMKLLADQILLGDDLSLNQLPKLNSRQRLDLSRQLVEIVMQMGGQKLGEIGPYNIVTGILPDEPSKRVIGIIDTFCDRLISSFQSQYKPDRVRVQKDRYCSETVISNSQNKKYDFSKSDDVWACRMTVFAIQTGRPAIKSSIVEGISKLKSEDSVDSKKNLINLSKIQSENGVVISISNYLTQLSQQDNHIDSQLSQLLKSIENQQELYDKATRVEPKEAEEISSYALSNLPWQINNGASWQANALPPTIQEQKRFMDIGEQQVAKMIKENQIPRLEEYMTRVVANVVNEQRFLVRYTKKVWVEGNTLLVLPTGQLLKFTDKRHALEGKAYLYKDIQSTELRKYRVYFSVDGLNPIIPDLRAHQDLRVAQDQPADAESMPSQLIDRGLWQMIQSQIQVMRTRQTVLRNRLKDLRGQLTLKKQLNKKISEYEKSRGKQILALMTFQQRKQMSLSLEIIPILSVRYSNLILINLRSNQLTDHDVQFLVDQHFTCLIGLKQLDLSNNFITDGGLRAIVKATMYNRHRLFSLMQYLSLENNQLKTCEALQEHHRLNQLVELDLRSNHFQSFLPYERVFSRLVFGKTGVKIKLSNNPYKRFLSSKEQWQRQQEERERYGVIIDDKESDYVYTGEYYHVPVRFEPPTTTERQVERDRSMESGHKQLEDAPKVQPGTRIKQQTGQTNLHQKDKRMRVGYQHLQATQEFINNQQDALRPKTSGQTENQKKIKRNKNQFLNVKHNHDQEVEDFFDLLLN